MKKFKIVLIQLLVVFIIFAGCAKKSKVILQPAPVVLPGVERVMKSPSYWISKLENPDNVVLNEKEITKLNFDSLKKGLLNGVYNFKDEYQSKTFSKYFHNLVITHSKYYDNSFKKPVGKDFIEQMESNIDDDYLSSTIPVRYAMTKGYAQLRVLPTNQPLMSDQENADLDRLQATQINLASPLAVLFHTKDENWYYVVSEEAEGWIDVKSIVFGDKTEIKNFRKKTKLAVTVSALTDVYSDSNKTIFIDHVKMGTELAVIGIIGDSVKIKIPTEFDGKLFFGEAFVDVIDVSIGYLKYTQSNVIKQAFKQLNDPYGWGGQYGEQDCSSFLKQVFACFGIKLARNSGSQIRQTEFSNIEKFEKEDSVSIKTDKIFENAVAGITLFYFPGHIMLYIGQYENKPYIIHSLWGYKGEGKNAMTYLINKVTISNMELGLASEKGSLIERTTMMKIIGK